MRRPTPFTVFATILLALGLLTGWPYAVIVRAAVSFVAGQSGGDLDDNPTTGAFDTNTGTPVTALVCATNYQTGTPTGITDGLNNAAWAAATEVTVEDTVAPDVRITQAFVIFNPVVSDTHTITFNGTQIFGSIACAAVAGTATAVSTSGTDASNGSTSCCAGAGVTAPAGSITVSFAAAVGDDVTGCTGCTLVDDEPSGGGGDGNAVGWTTSSGAINPTFQQTNSDRLAVAHIVFEAAGGGGGSTCPKTLGLLGVGC